MSAIHMKLSAVALIAGALMSVSPMQAAHAAATPVDGPTGTIVAPPPRVGPPGVQMFDCDGGTGRFGCGPGWFWRDGWRGMACYPC